MNALRKARQHAGVTLRQMSGLVGLSAAALHAAELRDQVDLKLALRYAEALDDPTVLDSTCLECPVRVSGHPRIFRELGNIRTDPATVAARAVQEMREAIRAGEHLVDHFGRIDYPAGPEERADAVKLLEQLVDVERAVEILLCSLRAMGQGALVAEAYDRQERKCACHGYAAPVVPEARRNGTEG